MDELPATWQEVLEIPDAAEQLRLIGDLLGATLTSGDSIAEIADHIPLGDILLSSCECLRQLRDGLLTPATARLLRQGTTQLIRHLATLVSVQIESSAEARVTPGFLLASFDRRNDRSEHCQLLAALARLLAASANWTADRFQIQPLRTAVDRMPPDQKAAFDSLRATLCECLTEHLPDARHFGPIVAELRRLQAMAQLRSIPEEKTSPPTDVDGSPTPVLWVFDLDGLQQPLMGCLLKTPQRLLFYYSSAWSDLIVNWPRDLSRPQSSEHIDNWHRRACDLIHQDRGLSILHGELEQLNCKHVRVVNLTQFTAPIEWGVLPGGEFVVSLAAGRDAIPAGRPVTTASFWGWSQTRDGDSCLVDQHTRSVRMLEVEGDEYRYPQLSHCNPLHVARYPHPLPLVHFERWLLEDLCREHDVSLGCLIDQEATRERFLHSAPSSPAIVHISTHGIAIPASPECSHLIFGSATRPYAALSFLDILSADWRNAQLVFLNACHTAAGKGYSGDAPLSLAWAFRAAGACTVIAARWPVGDVAAWHFTERFYRHWFATRAWADVGASFRSAVARLRDELKYPFHQWGAYVLLE